MNLPKRRPRLVNKVGPRVHSEKSKRSQRIARRPSQRTPPRGYSRPNDTTLSDKISVENTTAKNAGSGPAGVNINEEDVQKAMDAITKLGDAAAKEQKQDEAGKALQDKPKTSQDSNSTEAAKANKVNT